MSLCANDNEMVNFHRVTKCFDWSNAHGRLSDFDWRNLDQYLLSQINSFMKYDPWNKQPFLSREYDKPQS